jgi:hypothetical protein
MMMIEMLPPARRFSRLQQVDSPSRRFARWRILQRHSATGTETVSRRVRPSARAATHSLVSFRHCAYGVIALHLQHHALHRFERV